MIFADLLETIYRWWAPLKPEPAHVPIFWMGTRLQAGWACDWQHAQRAQHFLRTEGRPAPSEVIAVLGNPA
jgi:hypothetical protein